jgi:hypothetical protein
MSSGKKPPSAMYGWIGMPPLDMQEMPSESVFSVEYGFLEKNRKKLLLSSQLSLKLLLLCASQRI